MISGAIEHFTSGGPVGVDVGAIERDLASLWRMASVANSAVTRACSWNLVVHATETLELDRARSLAAALVAAVPSRTLVLDDRPDADGQELEAFVTANCRRLPGGGKLVCAEEITVEARGRGAEHLPSLVRALLVPDIPTAVLWAGLPPGTSLVAELVRGVDRVVLDSSRADALAAIAALGEETTTLVADLLWLRQSSLRRAVAAAFDPPTDATTLARISRFTAEAGPGGLNAAKLILGWIGARLEWGPPRRVAGPSGAGRWLVPRSQGDLELELRIAPTGAEGLAALSFETPKAERLGLRFDRGVACIEGVGAPRAARFASRSDEELVVAALGSRGSDPLYQAALTWARELER